MSRRDIRLQPSYRAIHSKNSIATWEASIYDNMRLLQNVLKSTLGRPLAVVAVAATLAAASAVAGAQASYPDKPLRLVMGFAAGGSVDPMARTITRMLGERLGQTIVLEHKPGAGGAIAVGSV